MLVLRKCWVNCPSNEVLVLYGGRLGTSARCVHGGGVFVIPIFQGYSFIRVSLQPILIPLELNTLCGENVKCLVKAAFTVAVSTEKNIMQNAAKRLLALSREDLFNQAKEIIQGSLRSVLVNM